MFRIISDQLFNHLNTLLSVLSRNHSVDGLGMFRLFKYGVRAYIHPQACLLRSSNAPPCLYPCDYSLFFYFCFIYSILYILHTLTPEIKSFHFTSQYRIAQRDYLSSFKLLLCKNHISPWIESFGLALVRTCFAYTRIRIVQIGFTRIHPIYLLLLFIITPHKLHGPWKGWPGSRTFRSFVLWCFI